MTGGIDEIEPVAFAVLARYSSVTGCMRIVIPRSRSRSIASSACSSRARVPTVRVIRAGGPTASFCRDRCAR